MMLPNGGYAAASRLDRIVSFLILILVGLVKGRLFRVAPGGASVREELGLRLGTGLVWLLTGYHAEIE